MDIKVKSEKRYRRHKRIRSKAFGTFKVPRFCVFRSSQHIYCQIIDDEKGETLVAASDQELKPKLQAKGEKLKEKKEETLRSGKVKIAFELGKLIAEKALKKKIKKVIFDRAGYQYHGRVKAVAEGAREGGLEF